MIRTPGQIERASMALIRAELRERGITLPTENEAVILRCIHASADFDYAANLRFTQGAVKKATDALHSGTELVTDTNMALAGISRPGLQKLGVSAYCYMAETFIADRAKAEGSTHTIHHYPLHQDMNLSLYAHSLQMLPYLYLLCNIL